MRHFLYQISCYIWHSVHISELFKCAIFYFRSRVTSGIPFTFPSFLNAPFSISDLVLHLAFRSHFRAFYMQCWSSSTFRNRHFLFQISCYIWHSVHISEVVQDPLLAGQPATCSYLIYDPFKRYQVTLLGLISRAKKI